MTKKKILVLGNGPQINQIEFDKLKPNIETFGVNRIWLKHYPTYFFFHDNDILLELQNDEINRLKLIGKSKCFTSDWIKANVPFIPDWVRSYPRLNRRSFPDSITTGIRILSTRFLKDSISNYTFYMAGINLKWTNPSHFWKESYCNSLNTRDAGWYTKRFSMMFKNFRSLKSSGFNMVSVTPESSLNKIMRYENINNLYV